MSPSLLQDLLPRALEYLRSRRDELDLPFAHPTAAGLAVLAPVTDVGH
jgi:hypothetical protein